MTESGLTARNPVWQELAKLYLDTDFDDRDLELMAKVLAASPYSIDQLQEIELWEVAPVVSPNLLSMAGVWSGFDATWVNEECAKRARWRSLLLRLAVPLGFRRFVTRCTG